MQRFIPYGGGKRNAFVLLSVIIALIYSNTLTAAWHLDDEPNILQNQAVQLSHLSFKSIYTALHANPSNPGQFYRPVAMLTLGLNWWAGKNLVVGYHIVNLLIHIECAFLLFLTIFKLFRCPNIKTFRCGDSYSISLLSAALWGVHPIHTQAVTYIVQRMAILSTLFFLAGVYFYVCARLSRNRRKASAMWGLSLLMFLFAVGSKENAALFPVTLILLEGIFFQNLCDRKTRNRFLVISLSILLFFGISCTIVYFDYFSSLINSYNHRSFSLSQRLMTEPRIVLNYLSQIFYPIADRFSIEHDIVVSTSLIKPWTTLPSILLIIIMISWSLLKSQRYPFLAFACLFYFCNQIVESSIIPLELIFEHRNYLPSLFIFMPIAIAINAAIKHYRKTNKIMLYVVCSSVTLLIVFVSIGTLKRNAIWETEWSLWHDAYKKAPNRCRPAYVLANLYYRKGIYDQAMTLYQKALHGKSSTPDYTRALVMNGIAATHFAKGEYKECISAFNSAGNIKPEFEQVQYNIILANIKMGNLEDAREQVDRLLSKRPENSLYNYLKGIVLTHQNKLSSAMPFFRNALQVDPNSDLVKTKIAETLSQMKEYRQAEIFSNISFPNSNHDVNRLVSLFVYCVKANKMKRANVYLDKLFQNNNLKHVVESLMKTELFNNSKPMNYTARQLVFSKLESFKKNLYSINY